MRLSECSYVVVDCETTGLHPSAHHRIVELALLPVDQGGTSGDVWCTLLRPDRDLGPTEIHGIRGRDLLDAPSFDEVLGEILDRLAGRVVVAHNARFDCAFLEHELERVGVQVAPLPALCTMQLAALLGLAGGRARLGECCAAIGVSHPGEHAAAADARACAALLAAYVSALAANGVDVLAELGCSLPLPASGWPRDDRRAPCKQRGERSTERREPTFLARLAQAAEPPRVPDAMQVAPYLDILDRALEDRRLSEAEQDDLAATAAMLGLSASRVRALHADYVGTLIALAYRDGVVTERERADLDLVAEALGVGGVDDALSRLGADTPRLGPDSDGPALVGKTVCFTGALCCTFDGAPITRDLAEHLARQAGMVVAPRVTKDLDILVVADPHSMSGKACKARDYGTRVVAETAFWPMIGVDVA